MSMLKPGVLLLPGKVYAVRDRDGAGRLRSVIRGLQKDNNDLRAIITVLSMNLADAKRDLEIANEELRDMWQAKAGFA